MFGELFTDIEIIAASSLLETDIYVYTKVGSLYPTVATTEF